MEAYAFVLSCALFAAAAAFTISDQVTEYDREGDVMEAPTCENGYWGRHFENEQQTWVCRCYKGWGLVPPRWIWGNPYCQKCNCGNENNCKFERYFFRILEECLCEVGYEVAEGKCKGTCKQNPCQNGGTCVVKGDDIACKCKESFAGKRCETDLCLQRCNVKYGKEDGYVVCSGGHQGKVTCTCKDKDKLFHSEDKKCKVDMCLQSCNVKYGTEDGSVVCSGDPYEKVACTCKDKDKLFHTEDKKCKGTCHDTSDCKNGGECSGNNKSRFCRCLDGTGGDFCEKVIGCETIDCGKEARCAFDVTTKSPTCACNDGKLFFDPTNNRCKKTCHDASDCKNGGECSGDNTSRFCRCLDGTDDDFCEKVIGCETIDCGNEARCTFDVSTRSPKCECTDTGLFFDPTVKKCKRNCKDGKQCQNGGGCSSRGKSHFCDCLDGTSGDLCETVDECLKDIHKCKGGSLCSFDIDTGKAICECADANHTYDPLDGECKKKWCTEKKCINGRCEVVDGKEVCSCYEGFVLEGDYCRRLNCSRTPCYNGTCIVRPGNREQCICPSGYTLDTGTCIRGVCRMDTCFGGRCKKIDGELMCVCPDRYSLEGIGCFETVCQIQQCFGGKCVVKNEEEICTCPKNHRLVGNVCKRILCEKKNCFGGSCNVVNGEEVCTCPPGFFLVEDVCREVQKRKH